MFCTLTLGQVEKPDGQKKMLVLRFNVFLKYIDRKEDHFITCFVVILLVLILYKYFSMIATVSDLLLCLKILMRLMVFKLSLSTLVT